MKHTPGPWHVGKGIRIIGANSQRVAVCDDNEATPGMDNARIIAAAPELLEALTILYGSITDERADGAYRKEALDKARAAIAKSTGCES